MSWSRGRVKVADFGVAKAVGEKADLNRTVTVVGNPANIVTTLIYQILLEDPLANPPVSTALGEKVTAFLRRYLEKAPERRIPDEASFAAGARAGQFVRVLPWDKGELIPLTLADWDEKAGTITIVIQAMGTSSIAINAMKVGEALAGIAGPLGLPSELHHFDANQTVVFTAGGVGLPPVYPIMREHLRLGNHVTLISGFRNADLLFWTKEDERVGRMQAEFPEHLAVIYTSNDGSFGIKGFVTDPLATLLQQNQKGEGRKIGEVVTIGPPLMMRAVSDLTRSYGVKTVASLNSIMVDATGMCGACMVPVNVEGKLVRKHACIDGPEIDAHSIDWDKFLPRFGQFKKQEQESKVRRGFA